METLNERKYTTEELVAETKKTKEKPLVSLNKIPGFNELTPDEKSILKYNVNSYNETVTEFNSLRKMMEKGRVPDSKNPQVVSSFRKLNNKSKKIYDKYIAPVMRKGASILQKAEVKSAYEKANKTKRETENQLASFKEKVKEYAKKRKEIK
jgi:hypothetical protein